MIKEFEDIRKWGEIRGLGEANPDVQFQRFLQEAVEIHEAMINNDEDEFKDAIGDTIVTLINLAKTKGYNAEDCLFEAFNVIKLRKGINKNGSFVRYGKLSEEDKKWCDEHQGNPGNQYFLEESLNILEPKDFIKS
jgi:NTP pyrophosphatase (non-canonical NTP hydrolase)